MSQESAEEPQKKFFEKFKKALRAYDFVTVFTLWKWLEDSLSKGNVTDGILAIRDFVDARRREVMLRWCHRIEHLFCSRKCGMVVELYKAFSRQWSDPRGASDLQWALGRFMPSYKSDKIYLMLAHAHLEENDLVEGMSFLDVVLDYYEEREKSPPQEAFDLRVKAYFAESQRVEARFFVEEWIERCKKKGWHGLRVFLNKLQRRLKKRAYRKKPQRKERPFKAKELANMLGCSTKTVTRKFHDLRSETAKFSRHSDWRKLRWSGMGVTYQVMFGAVLIDRAEDLTRQRKTRILRKLRSEIIERTPRREKSTVRLLSEIKQHFDEIGTEGCPFPDSMRLSQESYRVLFPSTKAGVRKTDHSAEK